MSQTKQFKPKEDDEHAVETHYSQITRECGDKKQNKLEHKMDKEDIFSELMKEVVVDYFHKQETLRRGQQRLLQIVKDSTDAPLGTCKTSKKRSDPLTSEFQGSKKTENKTNSMRHMNG